MFHYYNWQWTINIICELINLHINYFNCVASAYETKEVIIEEVVVRATSEGKHKQRSWNWKGGCSIINVVNLSSARARGKTASMCTLRCSLSSVPSQLLLWQMCSFRLLTLLHLNLSLDMLIGISSTSLSLRPCSQK